MGSHEVGLSEARVDATAQRTVFCLPRLPLPLPAAALCLGGRAFGAFCHVYSVLPWLFRLVVGLGLVVFGSVSVGCVGRVVGSGRSLLSRCSGFGSGVVGLLSRSFSVGSCGFVAIAGGFGVGAWGLCPLFWVGLLFFKGSIFGELLVSLINNY